MEDRFCFLLMRLLLQRLKNILKEKECQYMILKGLILVIIEHLMLKEI